MRHIKDKIVVACIQELGALDQLVSVAVTQDVLDALDLEEETQALLKLIDAETSLADVVRFSLLEKHVALKCLVSLNERGLITLFHANFSLPPDTAPEAIAELYGERDVANQRVSGSPRVPQPRLPTSVPSAAGPVPSKQSTNTSVPTGNEATDQFEALFQQATLAYLSGDLERALAGFFECQKLRPEDSRVQHNIARLRGDAP